MDQFCLKWNNFQASLVTAFSNLKSTEELADVTLTCEGQSIKAHKIILSACSPYFRGIFKENPCTHPIVILKDVLYNELLAILNFMYHGEVLITQDKLSSFLQTAEALQVSGLVSNTALHQIPLKSTQREEQTKTTKRSKKCNTKSTESDRKFEALVDSIKARSVEETTCINNNTNENPDAYDKQNSILEAALEVRDSVKEPQPSILERSLTCQATQQTAAEQVASEYDKRGTKHKATSDGTSATDAPVLQKVIKYEDDSSEETLRSYSDVQPHHSSQCGNCPHCGKTYSNQSALKYHVRLMHSDLTNMYCCHLCPEVFDFRECYKKHMADIHSVRN